MEFSFPPQRIVSLVPSQTELLFDLGLEGHIAGRTKFCVHPASKIEAVQVVGGTKKLRMNVIEQLQPDLVIGNKEENTKEDIEALSRQFPVWMSDISEVAEVPALIATFGELTGASEKAVKLSAAVKDALEDIRGIFSGNVAYLIWKRPWMAAGENTFINSTLYWLGFQNVIKQSRYPQLEPDELRRLDVDFIFLSSEPYPFSKRHLQEAGRLAPLAKPVLADGEMFSWYGSRLRKGPGYFADFKSKL